MTSHEMNEVIRHFDIVAESLRSDIQLLAEGHMALREALGGEIGGLRGEIGSLRSEMNARLAELHSLLVTSHTDLRQRVEALESPGA